MLHAQVREMHGMMQRHPCSSFVKFDMLLPFATYRYLAPNFHMHGIILIYIKSLSLAIYDFEAPFAE